MNPQEKAWVALFIGSLLKLYGVRNIVYAGIESNKLILSFKMIYLLKR